MTALDQSIPAEPDRRIFDPQANERFLKRCIIVKRPNSRRAMLSVIILSMSEVTRILHEIQLGDPSASEFHFPSHYQSQDLTNRER